MHDFLEICKLPKFIQEKLEGENRPLTVVENKSCQWTFSKMNVQAKSFFERILFDVI